MAQQPAEEMRGERSAEEARVTCVPLPAAMEQQPGVFRGNTVVNLIEVDFHAQ